MKKTIKVLTLVLFSALVLCTNLSSAITFYVSNTGNDSNTGDKIENPWKTIKRVNKHYFTPGDTISFKGGDTFKGAIDKHLDYDNSTDYVVINSYGSTKATLYSEDNKVNAVIRIEFDKHIALNISNLIIMGNYDPENMKGNPDLGIYIKNWTRTRDSTDQSNFLINDCEIRNIKQAGIKIVPGNYGKRFNVSIENNHLHDCGQAGINFVYVWYSDCSIKNNKIHDIKGYPGGNGYSGIGIQLSLCKKIICERNLIYNVGKFADISGIAILIGASKNIIVRYNEIYKVYGNSLYDAEAIDFENGSDSCIAEYNYIHNTDGVGALISGSSKLSVANNQKLYMHDMDSSYADYNIIRYNIFKECGNLNGLMSIKIASGDSKHKARGNLIYNNTIVKKKTASWQVAISLALPQDGTKIFNNIIITDLVRGIYIDALSNHINLSILNNCYWDKKDYQIITIGEEDYNLPDLINNQNGLNNNTIEKINGVVVAKIYNPHLENPFTQIDTVNNPYKIDTLSAYKFTSASVMADNGLNLDSLFGINPGLTDFYGNSLMINGRSDIGAYEDN
ncbi:MAG: right-handed parallel beta-helix repeat-containing protein [Bacteroidota bacterium]|nr:right-handed parallel beta-helix repeat-containing protein [Bacteroidota bacterium]